MATATNATIITNNQAKGHAILVYALIGIGLFTATPIIIGAVWAMNETPRCKQRGYLFCKQNLFRGKPRGI